MGSAHVGFADGREAVVGIRAEVEKTMRRGGGLEPDIDMVDEEGMVKGRRVRGRPDWVTLGLTLPGLRDDDKDLVFLEEMLRETLVLGSTTDDKNVDGSGQATAQSLPDALVINYRWHWHLYIDVLLISSPDQGNYPLPLLSMAIHLALRDTRLPRLKSEGDEDPVADDDWDAAGYLYSRRSKPGLSRQGLVPPVTLLVMVVAENVIFDPSSTELAVADGVLAISVGRVSTGRDSTGQNVVKILAVRSLETPARDTMKGVPRDAVAATANEGGQVSGTTDAVIPGVWKPKVGGVKRAVLMEVAKVIVGGGVGAEVLEGLDGFLGAV